MLSDNFDSASNGASAFNSTLSADQQGLLAPLTYSVTGHDADYKIQHGNGGQMLMAAWYGGESLDLYASLNHNFANAANGLNKPLKIQFDLKITDSSDADNWAAVAIGSAQNAFVDNSANKFSSLFRHNGGTQQFASGGDISNGSTWTASGSTIAVILSDTAGNGSPFNGNGTVVKMLVNDALVGTYPLAQMSASDGYLSFEGYGVFTNIDNLSLSVVSTPAFALTYNGNTSTSGAAPFDANNPYTENSTVTVLGNTGTLVKTGYSFANWNTAANGSGTTYNPGDTFTITAPVTLHAQWSPGPDFVWDNGAGTNVWSTTDANWLGAAWANSSSHNAWFQSVGGSINLAPGLTAGKVNVGNASANFPAASFSGGGVSAASLTVQGSGLNNGDYAANPSLVLNSTVILSGDAALGRANLTVTGGTLTANRIISAPASADWGRLAIQGGTVTANNGVDGSIHTAATFQLELNGGTLETPSIRVANRDFSTAGPDSINDAHLIWNGGMLKAIGPPENTDFITLYGDSANGSNPAQAAYVQAGGAIIDTNGRNIGIQVKLLSGSGAGGLTKNGSGTLTLTRANSYSGATTVNAGTLSLGDGMNNTNLADTAAVILSTGAVLNLNYSGTDTVNALSVGGIAKSPGVYSTANSAFITGPGTLTVTTGPQSDYDMWKTANNVTGGPDDDDDHDGQSNRFEYAFGQNPASPSGNPVVFLSVTSGPQLTYTRHKQSLTGLIYSVWTSTNLTDWTEDTGSFEGAPSVNGDVETVPVTISPALLSNSRLFIQVRAR